MSRRERDVVIFAGDGEGRREGENGLQMLSMREGGNEGLKEKRQISSC